MPDPEQVPALVEAAAHLPPWAVGVLVGGGLVVALARAVLPGASADRLTLWLVGLAVWAARRRRRRGRHQGRGLRNVWNGNWR